MNAKVITSDVVPTVTEYSSKKLDVIPGMEGARIESYASNEATYGRFNWIYGDNKLFVLTAKSEKGNYLY